jgi:hypothetical protein
LDAEKIAGGGPSGQDIFRERVQVAANTVPAFMASTNGTVTTATLLASVTSIAYLFHPGTSTKTIKIRKIVVSSTGGTNGVVNFRGAFITAENGVPGGTSQTINGVNRSFTPEAGDVFRTGATGAPTRVAGDLLSYALSVNGSSSDAFTFDFTASPITLRAGVAEGFEIRTVITNALVNADSIGCYFYWTEEVFV